MRIKICNFRLNDINRIYSLSKMLAHFFPDTESCTIGIYELLLNAVEHGNLGIGYEEKTDLIRSGLWHAEIMRRLALPEYADKELNIIIQINEQECRLSISDQGNGFPWRDFIRRAGEDHRPNGRGLYIAMQSSFDDLFFNPAGNEVTCVAQYNNAQ